MPYYQLVSYKVNNEDSIGKIETIVVKHQGKCVTSTIRNFIKRRLYLQSKSITIDIVTNEFISEEEVDRRYGNNFLDINIPLRFRSVL